MAAPNSSTPSSCITSYRCFFSSGSDLAQGRLVSILPNYSLGERHYYALYPQSRYLAPKVRAFVDFITDYYQTGNAAST